ncbi:xaa-Pro aminopeptidase ApepP [Copidosoma floridanum]|uniref:xaa-Pro aminopeptidase ApepP n=1 Tax=Copidosoma floridanum TaxID=29053 RepID=UPI0006C95A0E|nr:xaa-Pro aminopeptidase ApepP [Copidosoma floridanum]
MAELSGKQKLAHLRQFMSDVRVENGKGIQAFIITGDDAHQSEYIGEQDKRTQYISGFRGSSGTSIITPEHALLWTDGRYFAQALMELDPSDAWTLMQEGLPETPSLENWLISSLPANSRVGADPNLISNLTWDRLKNSLSVAGHTLLPIEDNLVDKVWGNNKPTRILNKILPQNIVYSGKTAGNKVSDCIREMQKHKVTTLILTALDEIAYLLNWRGSDIQYNPVFFAYVILHKSKVFIFTNEKSVTIEARQQLLNEGVDYEIELYENVKLFLRKIISSNNSQTVWISNHSSHSLHCECKSVSIYTAISPVCLMKLIKNKNEIEGMKLAHVRDGVALVKYFSWLENTITSTDNKVFVTEISGAEQLEIFRREQQKYVGPSFSTISAVGKNAAIIHYKPSKASDKRIDTQELYLCDSGAQFLDGTTDVTRTLHFGQPSDYHRECFTRVFKGQCSLARTKFPLMTKGHHLDSLARKYLWDVGLDYLHGTGHGVGAYLNVHELPTMISMKPYLDDPGLQIGMFVSNVC